MFIITVGNEQCAEMFDSFVKDWSPRIENKDLTPKERRALCQRLEHLTRTSVLQQDDTQSEEYEDKITTLMKVVSLVIYQDYAYNRIHYKYAKRILRLFLWKTQTMLNSMGIRS